MAGQEFDVTAVFAALPTPYVVMTPDLIVVGMNDAYLAATGRRREDLTGVPLLTSFPPPAESLDADGRSELQISLETVRDHGRPDTLPVQKYPIRDADGVMTERHWLAVHVPVFGPDGEVALVVQRTEDVTEFARERERVERVAEEQSHDEDWRRRARRVEADLFVRARELADALKARDLVARRVASLAEVALALAGATSVVELERIVVDRGLAVLGADGGSVISRAPGGDWRVTVNAALGEHVQDRYGTVPYDSALPGAWTARTGRRALLPTRDAGLDFTAEMAAVHVETGRLAWAFEPLTVGEECLGALVACWIEEHELGADDLEVFAGFAAQCAQALQRIRAAERDRAAAREVAQLAQALQAALLTPPPQPEHLQVEVRYRTAGHQAQVGGDWYDAFVQPDGGVVLVIGDVVGHDSVAAARMGQLRGLLRALAYHADPDVAAASPAVVLTRLEHAARGLAVDTMATTILASVGRPDDRQLGRRVVRWSSAGHPPPAVLLADGTVELLEVTPDLLLGVDPDAPRHDHVLELPDGATLLLYTDGLVERRGADLSDGLDGLQSALADLAAADLGALCDTVLARLAPHAGEDDIALLAVRAGGPPQRGAAPTSDPAAAAAPSGQPDAPRPSTPVRPHVRAAPGEPPAHRARAGEAERWRPASGRAAWSVSLDDGGRSSDARTPSLN